MLSFSSSENYNIVIAAGGLSDKNAFNRSTATTNSSSSLQPTQAQTTSHLRQVRSLEKEYNPSICEETQVVLPVPNINKIYGRSLDEILDKKQHDLGKPAASRTAEAIVGNLPVTTTTSILTAASSPGKRVPLIKTKNVDLNLANLVHNALPSANQVKSAPNSGDSSPKGNLSFDSDVGDLAISDPGDYTNYQSIQCTTAADSGNKEDADGDRKTPVSRRYYLTADNPSIKSSTSLDDELNLEDPGRPAEPYKLANIPSFLIEEEVPNKSTDEDDRQQSIDLSGREDKNDLNNNSLI